MRQRIRLFPSFSIWTALRLELSDQLHKGFIYKVAFTLLSTYYVLTALWTLSLILASTQ